MPIIRLDPILSKFLERQMATLTLSPPLTVLDDEEWTAKVEHSSGNSVQARGNDPTSAVSNLVELIKLLKKS